MARGDPDAQRPPPDSEPQRRVQVHRLAVDPGVHGRRGTHLQARRAPGPSRRPGAIAGYVENEDPELAGVERRPGARCRGIQRVGVVRHEHDGDLAMLAPQVVEQVQRGHHSAWTEHPLCGFQERAQLGIAIFRPADRVAVDPERDVVEERAAVDLRHVDLALNPVGERVERADHIMPVRSHIEREVVARPGWDAHERDPARGRCRGHDRERPVAASHAQRVRAARRGFAGQFCQILARGQDDGLDPPFARAFGNPGACGFPAARPRVDEQYRPARRIGRLPARRCARTGRRFRHPMRVALPAQADFPPIFLGPNRPSR
jgi:hypothetical protein